VLGSALYSVLKYIVVFGGNGIDVMLTYNHDRQFISSSRYPSVAVAILTYVQF